MSELDRPVSTSGATAWTILAGLIVLTLGCYPLTIALFAAGHGELAGAAIAGAIGLGLVVLARRVSRLRGFTIIISTILIVMLMSFLVLRSEGFFGTPRTEQKRTMADLRTIATAVEAYATDFKKYPPAQSVHELSRFVSPTYIRTLPLADGWGNPWRYQQAIGPDEQQSYFIDSAGKDGRWEQTNLQRYVERATTRYENDIIYSNGAFLQYPEGIQAN